MSENINCDQLIGLNEEQRKLIVCRICAKVLNPVTTVCCFRTFCKTCLLRTVANENECPECGKNIPDFHNNGWALNTLADSLIQTFKIKCNINGCKDVFIIKEKANHRCAQNSDSNLNRPKGLYISNKCLIFSKIL